MTENKKLNFIITNNKIEKQRHVLSGNYHHLRKKKNSKEIHLDELKKIIFNCLFFLEIHFIYTKYFYACYRRMKNIFGGLVICLFLINSTTITTEQKKNILSTSFYLETLKH